MLQGLRCLLPVPFSQGVQQYHEGQAGLEDQPHQYNPQSHLPRVVQLDPLVLGDQGSLLVQFDLSLLVYRRYRWHPSILKDPAGHLFRGLPAVLVLHQDQEGRLIQEDPELQ